TNAALACSGGGVGVGVEPPAAVVPMLAVVHGGIEVADLPCNRFARSAAAEGPLAAAAATAAAAVAGPSLMRDAASLVPAHSSASTACPNNSRTALPYLASRHMSQVAFLHMLQDGGDSDHSGAVDNTSPSLSQLSLPPTFLQLKHLCTLNLAALSREISGLRWIGQGGGGAVFQGMWQGAPVAVKFLLGDSQGGPGAGSSQSSGGGGIDMLEGVVSSVVNHPNVVHTFAFQCARLTEASFAPEPEKDGRLEDGALDEQGNRDLFESLLDTAGSYGGGMNAACCSTDGSDAGMRRGMHHLAGQGLGGSGSTGFGAAAAAATGAASRLGVGGGGGRSTLGHQGTRFGSVVQEAGAGAVIAATAAAASCTPDVKFGGFGDAVEVEVHSAHQRDGDAGKIEEYGGVGVGAGEGRRRVPDSAAAEGRLCTKVVMRCAVQAQQQLLKQQQQQREAALESTFQSD
ncbi:hypothetical protein Vretimale_17748, partial [Volvox reticuliferus]